METGTTATAIACALATAASASVTEIGEFTGDAFETFETIGTPGPTQGPASTFGGSGTAYDSLANSLMIATSLTSFLTGENIFPWNGNFMGGSVTGRMTFEFDTPVTAFGGYFGTADILAPGGSVLFLDDEGGVLETIDFTMPLNEWRWYGWETDFAFSRIEIRGQANPGAPIVFDDVRVNFVPAPAGFAALAATGLLSARRRR